MKNVISVLSLISFLFMGQIIQAQPTAALSETEQEEIQYMLEEEKLARDVYLELYEKWDSPVFENISSSEQRHLSKMKALAKQYDLTIPESVVKEEQGVFQNAALQKLYHSLVKTGSTSLEDAFRVGAQIEELDIKDLKAALKNTDKPAIQKVYTQLEQASENHLRSFTRNLEKTGAAYQPTILDQTDYDAIVQMESSGKKGCGAEKGKASCCGSKKGSAKATTSASCCSGKKDTQKGVKGKACCSGGKGKNAKTGNCGKAKN